MKLGLKIILPILSLLVLIIGTFGYILYNLKQQETVLSTEGEKIRILSGLNERLTRDQEQTDYNVLAYRFNQDRSSLLAISEAALDKSKTLDEMYPFITTSRGRELVNSYIDARKEVESIRNGLIRAIDEGNKEQITLNYNKWDIQTQTIKATLADIGAYNINSLEKTLVTVGDIRNKISEIIIILFFVVVATVLFFFLYLRAIITTPIIKLAQFADEVANKNFTTTTTTTITRKDELGILSRAFNTMVEKLRESYATLEQKVRDRTQELEQEKAKIEIIETRLKFATKSAGIGVWDWNIVKNNIVWDDNMFKLYGINRTVDTVAYNVWQNGLHPDDAKRVVELLNDAVAGKSNYDTKFRVIWPDKSIHDIRAFGLVIKNKDGKPANMIGINFDITKDTLIDKAKSEFVSLASHQLRTPLTDVSWHTEMILNGDLGEVSPKQKKYLEAIYSGNQRMIELVNTLLDVSRLELGTFFTVTPSPTDVIALAQGVLDEQKSEIKKKKLIISKKFSKDVPTFSADPKLLRMVFQNLLANAVTYTPEGGKIEFSVSMDKPETLLIKVADTGYGIPKNQQDKIFIKFFRADNVREKDTNGTGLGLYIVKSIVENAGGKIWFESEENKGTTFSVAIPFRV